MHVPIVLKSGSLNLLEPSGPVQACNGINLTISAVEFYRRGALLTNQGLHINQELIFPA